MTFAVSSIESSTQQSNPVGASRSPYMVVKFLEPDSPSLARKAWEIQAEGYLSMNFVHGSAIRGGVLKKTIDKARGDNVEYFIAFNRGGRRDEGSLGNDDAALRIVHVPEEGSLKKHLPAYNLCLSALTSDSRKRIEELPKSNVKEVAGLARRRDGDALAIFELIRAAVHDKLGQQNQWLFSIVSDTHQSLVQSFGSHAMPVIGRYIDLKDKDVASHIRLVPVLASVDAFIPNLARSLRESQINRQDSQARAVGRTLLFMTEGLTPEDYRRMDCGAVGSVTFLRRYIEELRGTAEAKRRRREDLIRMQKPANSISR